MATKLPPTPVGVPPGHSFWNDWYERLRSIVNSSLLNHNDLQNIQGGISSERYHLTAAQQTDLTDGGDSTSHFHSIDRARANHTGTQDHNTTLSGLQGGGSTDRYHLTQVQHTRATSFISATADPTTSDIAAGEWAMYKNTTSGLLKLWANDGGTMKSVTLT